MERHTTQRLADNQRALSLELHQRGDIHFTGGDQSKTRCLQAFLDVHIVHLSVTSHPNTATLHSLSYFLSYKTRQTPNP